MPSVEELARRIGGEATGELDRAIRGVAPLDSAGPHELSLVANRKYLAYLGATRAGAVLVSRALASSVPDTLTRILVADAHAALAAVVAILHPPAVPVAGIHPTAVLGDRVEVGDRVCIGPYAVIGAGAIVGDRASIGAHTVVGDGCVIGPDSVLHPQVTLYPNVRLGARCILHSGVRLGSDGFGYVLVDGEHRKIPQVGGCVLGDDVEIGANTTIDRGSIGNTQVGEGTKIDNLVHLGHNVRVGERAILIAQVGIAGSTTVGAGAVLGGQAGIAGHVSIGARARIGAQAGVTGDVPAGETVSGYPARPHREALRAQAGLFQLPALLRRLRKLEAAVFGGAGQEQQTGEPSIRNG